MNYVGLIYINGGQTSIKFDSNNFNQLIRDMRESAKGNCSPGDNCVIEVLNSRGVTLYSAIKAPYAHRFKIIKYY